MILSMYGTPVPSSDILKRLHTIDPNFSLKWLGPTRCWGVMFAWSQQDTRRIEVKKGNIAEEDARDLFCQLPQDCSADEAYGYLVQNLKAWRGTKAEVNALLDRVHLYNKQQDDRNMQPAYDLAEELVETNAPRLFAHEGKTSIRHFVNRDGQEK